MPPDRAQIESKLLAALDQANRLARDLLVARRPDAAPRDIGPPLATRSDGALLLNADYLPGSAFIGRSLWIGVVLEEPEAATIRAGLDEAVHELVANLVGKIQSALDRESEERESEEPEDEEPEGGRDHGKPTITER
jgi:hypothetical protein